MERRETIYGMILSYDDAKCKCSPSAYQITGDQKWIKVYQDVTRRDLNALFASIRRHKSTRKGSVWAGYLWAIASCREGQFTGLNEPNNIRSQKNNTRDRLHIHLLVVGEPGSTICQYIKSYWKDRGGYVRYKKLTQSNALSWADEYFSSQSIVDRTITL